MLENGRDGHDKEAAEEAERGEDRQELAKAQARLPEPGGENRECPASPAARGHTRFCRRTSNRRRNSPARCQPPTAAQSRVAVRRINVQNVLAVINHPELHQRSEEEKIHIAQAGQPEHAILPHHS